MLFLIFDFFAKGIPLRRSPFWIRRSLLVIRRSFFVVANTKANHERRDTNNEIRSPFGQGCSGIPSGKFDIIYTPHSPQLETLVPPAQLDNKIYLTG
jgi:hypothetical protein